MMRGTENKKQRTKIEGEIAGLWIIIREIGVQSGHVYRILARFQADSAETVQAEFEGALAFCNAQKEAK